MSIEQTLSIIKPDAVRKSVVGKIIDRFESNQLKVVACKMVILSQEQAEQFYGVHKDRPFFPELVEYMTSGPIVVQVLEGQNAIQRNRDIMGETDRTQAETGTNRAEFAESDQANAVHGSDAYATAQQEIAFFFNDDEIYRCK